MNIWVSSLASVHFAAKKAQPSKVISLLTPGDEFPEIDGVANDAHHKIHMHDIREPKEDHVTPGEDHVKGLINFIDSWSPETTLLVHCWAGISRSSATAFIAACHHNPSTSEDEIARRLRDTSETAYPNTLIVAHADKILGRDSKMVEAIAALPKIDFTSFEGDIIAKPFSIPSKF